MTFPVVWLMPDVPRVHNDSRHRLTWAQAQIEEILTGLGGDHRVGFDELGDEPGAAVVVPAEYYTDQAEWLNNQFNNLDWAVVFLTSDEASRFHRHRLYHRLDRMRVWVQTPRPGQHAGSRFLPFGSPPDTRMLLADTNPGAERRHDWYFAGQINHPRRTDLADALRDLPGGLLEQTKGFTQGRSRPDFLATLAEAKVIPCPSGPATPDSFRVWEAIEAGCLPVADRRCPGYAHDNYWQHLLGVDGLPFPTADEWKQFPDLLDEALAVWPANANRAGAWWSQYQRDLRRRIAVDITDVSGSPVDTRTITVLVPTSSIPAHPDTAMIEETVGSVRHHLPDADILILADGVRPDQEHRRADYEAYQQRLLWLCRHVWDNVSVVRFDDFQHQANMVRRALELVDTPLVLFVEHDTPLVTDLDIGWAECSTPIMAGDLDVVRFHYEAVIPDSHRKLMLDEYPAHYNGCPVLRTRQFSARPHLASTWWYRRVIDQFFPPTCRTFVEDKLHSVCQVEEWDRNRLAIYAPDMANLKRSVNLDGRGDDTKADCVFA